MNVKTILGTAALICSSIASAQDAYIKGSVSFFDTELSASGFSSFDTKPNALDLRVGSTINQNVAVEGLIMIGIGDDEIGPFSSTFEVQNAIGFNAILSQPLNEQLSIYGKFGLVMINYEDSDSDSAEASGASFGFGASFKASEQVSIFGEYTVQPDGEYDDFPIDVESSTFNVGLSMAL